MIQNTQDVKLDFLYWSFTWLLWLLCLVMALVAIAWFGLGVLRRHRRRRSAAYEVLSLRETHLAAAQYVLIGEPNSRQKHGGV